MAGVDNDLLSSFRSGDERGYGRLIYAFREPVFLYAKSIVSNVEIAHEIIDDVFLRLWDQRHQIIISTSFKSYLFRMVHNACIDYLRSANRQTKISMVSIEEQNERSSFFEIPDSSTVFDNLFSDQYELAFARELEKLPEQCREIFILCRFEQLSYPEIAKQMNISLSTVKTQMVRAMVKLREGLKDFL